ncbi:hypothetical protein TURU_085150 [Turdus rufiventris]|nr:hypothetical protein TURU_085150 [Turdus rufiventris]
MRRQPSRLAPCPGAYPSSPGNTQPKSVSILLKNALVQFRLWCGSRTLPGSLSSPGLHPMLENERADHENFGVTETLL